MKLQAKLPVTSGLRNQQEGGSKIVVLPTLPTLKLYADALRASRIKLPDQTFSVAFSTETIGYGVHILSIFNSYASDLLLSYLMLRK